MSTQTLDLKLTNDYIVDVFGQTDHFEIHQGIADAASAKAAWSCVDFIEKFLDGKGDVFKPSEELARELRGEGIQRPTL